jgi:hypothetical protein
VRYEYRDHEPSNLEESLLQALRGLDGSRRIPL